MMGMSYERDGRMPMSNRAFLVSTPMAYSQLSGDSHSLILMRSPSMAASYLMFGSKGIRACMGLIFDTLRISLTAG